MDKKINKIIEQYFCNLKDDLCSKINNEYYDDSNKDELIKYIYNYNRLVIDKEDFSKRKRAKNVVPAVIDALVNVRMVSNVQEEKEGL